jgi:hypothetical protein
MSYISGSGFVSVKEVGPKPPEGADVWWRADDKRYANYDPWAEFEQPSGSHLVIELTPFEVVKYTPKGVRLRNWIGYEFFVLGTATSQKAVPTQELALRDLVKRKEIHAEMAQKRADRAKEHLDVAKKALFWSKGDT